MKIHQEMRGMKDPGRHRVPPFQPQEPGADGWTHDRDKQHEKGPEIQEIDPDPNSPEGLTPSLIHGSNSEGFWRLGEKHPTPTRDTGSFRASERHRNHRLRDHPQRAKGRTGGLAALALVSSWSCITAHRNVAHPEPTARPTPPGSRPGKRPARSRITGCPWIISTRPSI